MKKFIGSILLGCLVFVVGCTPDAPKQPDPFVQDWNQHYARAITDFADDAATLTHDVKMGKDILNLDFKIEMDVDWLNVNNPDTDMDGWLNRQDKLTKLIICEYSLSDIIYFYGMKIGDDPSVAVENCSKYGNEKGEHLGN